MSKNPAEAKNNQNKSEDFKHLVRVANTDLDGSKNILYALTKIKGVSVMFANAVLNITGISKTAKSGFLNDDEISKLSDVLENPGKYKIPTWLYNRRKDYDTGEDKHLLTADLQFTKENDIKRLKKIKSYRGFRHAWGLPVRGQRTKSNFRKSKGKVTGVKRKK